MNRKWQGAYLGGAMVSWPPPLGRQDSIIPIELYAKVRHAPPPFLFVTWTKAWAHKRTEDKSSSNFGQENGLILSGEIFLLIFIILKFSGPPLSKILRTLLHVTSSRTAKPLDVKIADRRYVNASKNTDSENLGRIFRLWISGFFVT